MKIFHLPIVAMLLSSSIPSGAADVVLVNDSIPGCSIHVSPAVMETNRVVDAAAPFPMQEAELQRQRLRDSVKDLALYLGKMSGAKIELILRAPQDGDKWLPILVGDIAARAFGPPAKTSPYKQGWRMVVSPKAVGLMGESDEAASYAIYELLDRLGCRWYMPSDLGEVIPGMKTISLPTMDISEVPATISRRLTYADEDFKRRNRQGGTVLLANHALEINNNYISAEQLKAHPDWIGKKDGKDLANRLCWGNSDVGAAVADGVITRLDKGKETSVSIAPADGADFCECPRCKALDAGDRDPSMDVISITDRYMHFCNPIAEKVCRKHPEVLLGFLAYVQYTRPPVREKVHPNLVPEIAPITYCRAHSMMDPACPSRQAIRPIVEGWSKVTRNIAYYNFMFHLAEVSVPYPMMSQMSDELPFLYSHGVNFWQPETMPNFESVLPGLWLSIRMSWNTKAKPSEILDEFFTRYYGAASIPMREYWQVFDDAWVKVPEHAGCGAGYPRRFTPEVLQKARQAMDAAFKSCKTPMEKRRVKMSDDSLRQFELFMKMRRDLFDGRLENLEKDGASWAARQAELGEQYLPQFAFGSVVWTPKTPAGKSITISGLYFNYFYKDTCDDGARIAKVCNLIAPSIRKWRYAVDRERQGEKLGWSKPEFDHSSWKETDPCIDTWYALGLEAYYGPVWYRQTIKLPDVPAKKHVYLWVSSTDGNCKVFVNGQHIPHVDEKGVKSDEFSGYCKPASFDVTSAIKPGAENQITLIGTRLIMNELGTGGLMGPVLFCQDK